jgi:hypothetical protein
MVQVVLWLGVTGFLAGMGAVIGGILYIERIEADAVT